MKITIKTDNYVLDIQSDIGSPGRSDVLGSVLSRVVTIINELETTTKEAETTVVDALSPHDVSGGIK